MAYSDTDLLPISLVFPGLLTVDERLNPIPWAAAAMPNVSSDGTIYTFQLRQGRKFSDGEPIDASDFAYSLNRIANPCTSSPVAYYLYSIKDAENFNGETCGSDGKTITGPIQTLIGDSLTVADPQTLKITLTQPTSYFLSALTSPSFSAVPKQLINQYGDKWTDHLTDNGGFGGAPFKVTTWDHAGHLDLKSDFSSNATLVGFIICCWDYGHTAPKLRDINITIYKDAETAYQDYLAGKNDIADVPTAHLAEAKAQSKFYQNTSLTTFELQENWAIAPFDDVRVRQAFALGIDKQAICTKVLKGACVATNHIVPPGIVGYNDNLVGPDGTKNLTGNPTKAKALLTQYVTDKLGGDATKLPKIVYTQQANSQTAANLAAALQQMWQQNLGVTVSIENKTSSQISQGAKTIMLRQFGWQDDYPAQQDFLSYFFEIPSSYNVMGVNDTTVDGLLKDADKQLDASKAQQEYTTAEQMMVTECGWVPEYHGVNPYLLRSWVGDYNPLQNHYPSVDQWYNIYIAQH